MMKLFCSFIFIFFILGFTPASLFKSGPPPTSFFQGFGLGSYYGEYFHGQRTANGEFFDMNEMTAAHRTLPFGTIVRVTNFSNGLSVVVRINDRGPFRRRRIIDLSYGAARRIRLDKPEWIKLEILGSVNG